MNTSDVEIGEVACRALQSLDMRRKERGKGGTESKMGANHERDRAGRERRDSGSPK